MSPAAVEVRDVVAQLIGGDFSRWSWAVGTPGQSQRRHAEAAQAGTTPGAGLVVVVVLTAAPPPPLTHQATGTCLILYCDVTDACKEQEQDQDCGK